MEIKNHKLTGGNTDYVEANSFNRSIDMKPDSIIIHYTAGPSGDATVRLFKSKNSRFSAHIVVHEDGKITQMVPFNRRAIHAGKSYYDGRSSFNRFSIGIEISNPGYLVKNPKGEGYVTWWEKKKSNPTPVADDLIYIGKHRNSVTRMTRWHKYTDEQIKAVFELCKVIAESYEIKYVLGHDEIAPGRKTDPGPAFPLDELRMDVFKEEKKTAAEALFGAVTKQSALTIGRTKVKLNFRKEPSLEATKMADPIPSKAPVYIIKEDGSWLNIFHEITGWMDKEDIEQDNTDEEYDGIVLKENSGLYLEADDKSKKLINPFTKDTKVAILEQKDGFVKVMKEVEGWVAGKYVTYPI